MAKAKAKKVVATDSLGKIQEGIRASQDKSRGAVILKSAKEYLAKTKK